MYGMPTASDFQMYSNPNYSPSSSPMSGGLSYGAKPTGMFGGMSGMDALNFGLQGLSTIGNFWNAFQAQKLAKQQFAFTKEITNTNLNNQIKSYNTTLEDRARARGVVEGRDAAYTDNYIDQNKLTR